MKILVWLKNVQRLSWENNSKNFIRLGSVVVISIFGTCNYWSWPLKDFHIVNPLSYKSLSTHKSNHHRSIKCWFFDPSIFVFLTEKITRTLYHSRTILCCRTTKVSYHEKFFCYTSSSFNNSPSKTPSAAAALLTQLPERGDGWWWEVLIHHLGFFKKECRKS